MNRSPIALCAAVAAVSLVSFAGAAVVVNPVNASVSFSGTGGSLDYSAAISKQLNIGDIGTVIGQYGTNAAIRGRWSAQLVGGEGAGAHGGNVYAIAVQIGSCKKIGPFARDYQDAVLLAGDGIGNAVITNASIGFGVGGGGLRFDDFGGANQILIDNSGSFGDAAYSMRTDPNFAGFGVTGVPGLMNTYATVAADGSVGFSTTFNVSSLWVAPDDVSALFNGNLTEWEVRGFNSSFFVEVVSVPAPGAIALLGLAGLAARRRR